MFPCGYPIPILSWQFDDRFVIRQPTFAPSIVNGHFGWWIQWVDSSPSWLSHNRSLLRCRRRATFGQKRPFAVGSGKVRFQIKKRSLGQHAFGLNPLEVDS